MAQNLLCNSMHQYVNRGTNIELSLREFLAQGIFADTCLVIMGDSQMGKTELAKMLCATMADRLQTSGNAYFLKCGTVDSARDAVYDGQLKEGVPLFFDDLTPGDARGSRPPHSLDGIVHFTEVASSTSANARNRDMKHYSGCPSGHHDQCYGTVGTASIFASRCLEYPARGLAPCLPLFGKRL